MGKMAYGLRLISGLGMVVAALLGASSFDPALNYLAHPTENQFYGALMLIAVLASMLVFLAAGVVWILSDISEQLAK